MPYQSPSTTNWISERKHVIVVADLQLCGIFRSVSFTEISAFSLTPSFHLLPWRIFQPVPGLILLIGGLRLLNTDLPLIISDHYVYLINLLDALLVFSHLTSPLLSFLFCHISGSMWKIGLIIHLMSQEKMKILSRPRLRVSRSLRRLIVFPQRERRGPNNAWWKHDRSIWAAIVVGCGLEGAHDHMGLEGGDGQRSLSYPYKQQSSAY